MALGLERRPVTEIVAKDPSVSPLGALSASKPNSLCGELGQLHRQPLAAGAFCQNPERSMQEYLCLSPRCSRVREVRAMRSFSSGMHKGVHL